MGRIIEGDMGKVSEFTVRRLSAYFRILADLENKGLITVSSAKLGELGGVNTNEVDGAPTLDNANSFFWVSTSAYNPPLNYDTLFSGNFNETTGNIDSTATVVNLSENIPGHINFDLEITSFADDRRHCCRRMCIRLPSR